MKCNTCSKRRNKLGLPHCAVLTENIGLKQKCWAWTDDPDWEKKAKEAAEKYRLIAASLEP